MVSESYAKSKDIPVIAELLACGSTLDAHKITAPDPSGLSIERALKETISVEGFDPRKIDYIQAHGTATRHNDPIELAAIQAVLGNHATQVPISSTKDRHGHAIAAAGIQEFNILMNCFEHDYIPGNMNLKNPIDQTMNLPRMNQNKRIEYALTNNFAFGGVNASILTKNMT